jgi:hypothetical protein
MNNLGAIRSVPRPSSPECATGISEDLRHRPQRPMGLSSQLVPRRRSWGLWREPATAWPGGGSAPVSRSSSIRPRCPPVPANQHETLRQLGRLPRLETRCFAPLPHGRFAVIGGFPSANDRQRAYDMSSYGSADELRSRGVGIQKQASPVAYFPHATSAIMRTGLNAFDARPLLTSHKHKNKQFAARASSASNSIPSWAALLLVTFSPVGLPGQYCGPGRAARSSTRR